MAKKLTRRPAKKLRLNLVPASGLRKGAYILSDATNGEPAVLLIATGSEVSLCVEAQITHRIGRLMRDVPLLIKGWGHRFASTGLLPLGLRRFYRERVSYFRVPC
jgi:hypothetical protein